LILNTHSVFSVLTGHFCVVTFRVYWNQLREDLYSLGMNIAISVEALKGTKVLPGNVTHCLHHFLTRARERCSLVGFQLHYSMLFGLFDVLLSC